MTPIPQLTATEMAAKIRQGALSAQEVLAAHRDQVAAVNAGINAFVTLDWAAAEARAAELDQMAARGDSAGPLHGLPIAIGLGLPDSALPEDWRAVILTPPLEPPSLSIPCGTSSDGMPVGLHITGPKGSDAKLLRFARSIERALSGD